MNQLAPYLLIFLAGFAGSIHCIGMCGGFACGLGVDKQGCAATFQRHVIYNLGRVTSYCFMGTVLAYFGMHVMHSWEGISFAVMQRALASVSGLLMIFVGLQFFGVFKKNSKFLTGIGTQIFAQTLGSVLRHDSKFAPLALGVINGFLPCPLVYAFALQAAATSNPLSGFYLMGAFGLGTFPAMLAMGTAGVVFRSARGQTNVQTFPASKLSHNSTQVESSVNWRAQGIRLSATLIIVLGLITVTRGVLPMSMHMH